jgi:hypothetical protein
MPADSRRSASIVFLARGLCVSFESLFGLADELFTFRDCLSPIEPRNHDASDKARATCQQVTHVCVPFPVNACTALRIELLPYSANSIAEKASVWSGICHPWIARLTHVATKIPQATRVKEGSPSWSLKIPLMNAFMVCLSEVLPDLAL